jgi:phosphohistidine swiveling domain-containing protein
LAGKIEPKENFSYYEFSEQDIDDTWWIYDGGHTPPGAAWGPMFVWWWLYGVDVPLAQAMEDMPTPRSKGPRSRSYRGYHMVTVSTPVSEEEVQERTERYREAIRPWLEDPDKILKQAISYVTETCDKYKKFNYAKASWRDLIQVIVDFKNFCHNFWYWHFYTMVSTGAIFVDWESLSRELLGIDGHHPTFQKLMRGFNNNNFETERQLYNVSQAFARLGVKDTVLKAKVEDIIPKLQTTDAGRKALAELNKFLDKFGWRNFMMDSYETPSWREDPSPALMRIQQFLTHPTFRLDEVIAKQSEERKQAEEEVVNALPVDQREWYRILMRTGQRASVWMEDHSFYFEMQGHSVGRYMWLEIGKRLVATKALDKPDDILFLVPDEVLKILTDPFRVKYQKVAARRRADWLEVGLDEKGMPKFIPNNYYGRIPEPEAMMQMGMSGDVIFTKVTKEAPPAARPELKADLIGVSGSPGIAEGLARVIFSPAQQGLVQPGEILVAPITDSTWTPVFSLVAGVVLDTGAPLCHAAIVAREYGIPAVINTSTGTQVIKTGQRIRVDADVGAVYILKK